MIPVMNQTKRLTIVMVVLGASATTPALSVDASWKKHKPIGPSVGDAPLVLQAWRAADNRSTCAPLMFRSIRGAGPGARPRIAYFGGGWGIAYDLPGVRSAFGVAGAGISVEDRLIDLWTNKVRWNDGSWAGYGLEGGHGPGYLAYMKVAGQRCLYNVWSHVGEAKLRSLLKQLVLVETT